MKKLFKYLIYLSLGFLAFALYSSGYFENFQINDWFYFYLSIPFLFLGFLGQSYQWKALLRVLGFNLSFRDALISTGLPIFGKYIPGKVWLLLGRASYVGTRLNLSLKEVTWYSIVSQSFTLWIGLLIGSSLFLHVNEGEKYLFSLLGGLLIISILIFNPPLLKSFEKLIKKLTKRELHLPYLKPIDALKVSPYFLITWISWSIGFYFFTVSISPEHSSLWLILIFPLAASLGIMAILVPGGLGVREGILVGLMALLGIDLELAIKVSVMQRVWFLLGEVFIFLIGFALNNWKMSFNDK